MRRPCVFLLVLVLVLSHGAPVVAQKPLDDLMMDLNIAPLDPQAPPALSVTALEGGGRLTLADLKGRAVLVYFWATW